MRNKLPTFADKTRICIICEGDEEHDYLDKLRSLNVWSKKYSIILENADGNGNVPARYQDKYQNGFYNIVLAFCDTDRKPYEQYEEIKQKINEFHGVENAAVEVLIFGNPCTMQIVLTHWVDAKLKSPAKKTNAPLIRECTGVENYKGRADQRQQLFAQITKENYQEMCKRMKQISSDDTLVSSSNFGRFMDYFMSEDESWIDEINEKLD